ncbi:MAG: exodeoxyribonuclease III, partial [Oxalobacter sp.]|nr:exodeoxyribonuclease III [Oxalobacter sp.]
MKLATWNVNSLRVRLPQVLDWLKAHPVDVLCLQETKITDDRFPFMELAAAGYEAVTAGQKTYNGVAILSRHPLSDVVRNNPLYVDDQQRIIAATLSDIRVICAYVPNGQAPATEKYAYKLAWLSAFHDWVEQEKHQHPRLAILGDYNIAPENRDVHDPAAWEGHALVSPPERAAFSRLTALGLKDAYRLFEQPESGYSWWDYRQAAFRRDMGLRIDHI